MAELKIDTPAVLKRASISKRPAPTTVHTITIAAFHDWVEMELDCEDELDEDAAEAVVKSASTSPTHTQGDEEENGVAHMRACTIVFRRSAATIINLITGVFKGGGGGLRGLRELEHPPSSDKLHVSA